MATSKPRITISLDPHAYEVVSRLSGVTHKSMSAVVTEFLEIALPQMRRMVSVLEKADQASEVAKSNVRRSLNRAEGALLPMLVEGLKQTELQLEEAGLSWDEYASVAAAPGPAEPASKPSVRGRKGALTPVSVTRGVGQAKRSRKGAQKVSSRG